MAKTTIKKTIKKISLVAEKKEAVVKRTGGTKVSLKANETKVILKEKSTRKIFLDVSNVSTSTTLDILMNCTVSEQVGDVVYVDGSGAALRASNSSITTGKAIGFIVAKPTSTTCQVRSTGTISGFILTTGSYYFLGNSAGAITTLPPIAANSVVTRVGQAISSSTLLININNNYTIRS